MSFWPTIICRSFLTPWSACPVDKISLCLIFIKDYFPGGWFQLKDLLKFLVYKCIARLRVIHPLEIIIWKPWLVYGMDRYGWPSVSDLVFRPENPPPFLLQPPPQDKIGYGNGDQKSDRIAYLPDHVGRGRSSNTQECLSVSINS